jgi:hypothetical protein
MINFSVILTTKNKKSFNLAKLFFFKELKNKKKLKYKANKQTSLTILKSPHVHKIAQETFSYRIYTGILSFFYLNFFKFFYAIKKIKSNSFYDIKFKFLYIFKRLDYNTFSLNYFFLNFFNLSTIKFYKIKRLKTYLYLKTFSFKIKKVL